MDLSASIILEDNGLIVVDKPPGMPTAGDRLDQPGSLQYELMRHFRRKVWAVHQLDRDTSGLNLFVRRKALVAQWSAELAEGTKAYLAVCDGRFDGGSVDQPLGWLARGQRGVVRDGDAALTTFHARAQAPDATLLEATIRTGRTHQIRIHAAWAGHPLVGDERYGGRPDQIGRQALHAWRIATPSLEVEVEPPDDFRALLERLGLPWP